MTNSTTARRDPDKQAAKGSQERSEGVKRKSLTVAYLEKKLIQKHGRTDIAENQNNKSGRNSHGDRKRKHDEKEKGDDFSRLMFLARKRGEKGEIMTEGKKSCRSSS